jgi:sec-independent protein translocase protein TatA
MPGFIGVPELILLGLLALILFGPKRLPEMGRGLGKGMREFKDSISGETSTSFTADEDETATFHTLPTGTTVPVATAPAPHQADEVTTAD